MNFAKLFAFVIFGLFASVVLSSALVSAASLDFGIIQQPNLPISHDAGSFQVTVQLNNSGDAATLAWTATNIQGTVSGVTSELNSIEANTNRTFNLTISYPANQRGSLQSTITVDPSGLGSSKSATSSVTISDSKSLTTSRILNTNFIQNGTFTVKNSGNVPLSGITLTSSGDFPLNFVPNTAFDLATPGQSSSTITVVPTTTGVLRFGTNTAFANVRASDGTQTTQAFNLQKSFCKAGPQGTNLSITRVDISNSDDDDQDWMLLNNLEVRVKVENTGDNTIREVQVELGIFDSTGRNRVGDLDFSNTDEETVNIGSINDGNNEEATFNFRVPADFDTGNYQLAVKAYSDKDGETKECIDHSSDLDNDFYQSISVDSEDSEEKFIVVDDISVPTSEVSCGQTVTGSFELFNIGDQDQDQVLVTLKNQQLGLNKEIELRENLDQGDSKSLDFTFDVPRTAKDGSYTLEFKTYYDYRNGVYREESSDTFSSSIKVIGCGAGTPTTSGLAITADLSSEAKPGQELTVSATFRNTGSSPVTLTLSADGFNSWASSSAISRKTLTLNAGESKTADFTFNVKSDAAGAESFTIVAKDDSGKVSTQDVEVNFNGTTSPSTGFNFSAGNSTLWIIGIINVVLIVLIVFVAIRLARR